MNNNVEEEVKKWFKDEGYPLEMRVAKIFNENGFTVTLSSYYEDTEENKFREIDVIASTNLYFKQSAGLFIDLTYVIECKRSVDAPWLLLQSGADRECGLVQVVVDRVATKMGKNALLELSLENDVRNNKVFAINERLSYGVTRALKEKRDVAYKALLSSCKAASARAISIDKQFNKAGTRIIEFIFPMVIIEGQLFECSLSANNDVLLNATSRGTVLFRNPSAGENLTYVDIVSEHGLKGFLDQIKPDINKLKNHIDLNLKKTKDKIEMESF